MFGLIRSEQKEEKEKLEVVQMSTVRTAMNTLINFEEELRVQFAEKNNFIGEFGADKARNQLKRALETLEKFKFEVYK